MKTAAPSLLAYGEIWKVGACALKNVKGKQVCSFHGLVKKRKEKRVEEKAGRQQTGTWEALPRGTWWGEGRDGTYLPKEVLSAAVAGLPLSSFACVSNADGVNYSCVLGSNTTSCLTVMYDVFGCSLMREGSDQRRSCRSEPSPPLLGSCWGKRSVCIAEHVKCKWN